MGKTRRVFLIGSAAVVGGAVFGLRWRDSRMVARAEALTANPGEASFSGWMKIASDDTITIYIPHVDMGQGVHTALAQMLVDELDGDWRKVRTEHAPADQSFANGALARGFVAGRFPIPGFLSGATDVTFGEVARFINLQITGGSTAVRFTGQAGMRIIGAAAREVLVGAAAVRLGVPADELTTADSVVSHKPSGRTLRYGEIADAAGKITLSSNPTLKQPAAYKLIGKSMPRLDIPAKVTGAAQYGIDFSLPNMRVAAIAACPVIGGLLDGVEPAPAMAVTSVERVLGLDNALVVIAKGYWAASKGLAALQPRWKSSATAGASTASLYAEQDRALDAATGSSTKDMERGDAAAAYSVPGARIVEATYRVPFISHAAMEPLSITAHFKDGTLTVWGGMQDGLTTKAELVKLSGLPSAKVTFHPMAIGGAFGRRLPPSATHLKQIVKIAMQVNYPVKLIWSREEEFTQGPYRPQLTARLKAALDAGGKPVAWSNMYVGQNRPADAAHVMYAIPNLSLRYVTAASPVAHASWRAVAHTQGAFYTECFIDEMAHAAGVDPFVYRRDLLPSGSRARHLLEEVTKRSGWGNPLPAGEGRGIAIAEAMGTLVAHVVEVSVTRQGKPRVKRVVSAVDCGPVVHPDTARQQIEGSIIMALSAALGERITLKDGQAVQRNFPEYPILTLADAPFIDVHFVTSDASMGGLGEPGVPPVAPALVNAMFAATGRRVRELPIDKGTAA